MESLLQFLRMNLGGNALTGAVLIGLVALTVFAFSLGVSAVVMGLADPMRRRSTPAPCPDPEDTCWTGRRPGSPTQGSRTT